MIDVARYYEGGWALLPESILLLGVVLLLLSEAFSARLARRSWIATLAFLAAALLAAALSTSQPGARFSGMIVVDGLARFFRIFALLAGVLGVVIAIPSDEIETRRRGEYFSLYLALIVGLILMGEASDLIMLYLAIELVSLMSYVLAGFRPRDQKSAEAALKYVIYGGAASGIMLFGFSLLYGLTGETQLSLINLKIVQLGRASLAEGATSPLPVALTGGIAMSLAGFLYKIAAVPLHMWSPDVYEGAPTPFSAFLSTGPKAAGFAALIRFFAVGLGDATFATQDLGDINTLPWIPLLMVVSALTMLVGNLSALGQSNIKRFLAYSSIAHAGYSLVGLIAFTRTGLSSVLLYLCFYLVMNIGAFYSVIWARVRLGDDQIQSYRGFGYRAPVVAVGFAICLLSLTGLPPLAGFVGKFYLFASALDRGAKIPIPAECLSGAPGLSCALAGGTAYYALALCGALNSAISLYYYARVVGVMFLKRPSDEQPFRIDPLTRVIMTGVSGFLIVFGIAWTPLWELAQSAVDFQRPLHRAFVPLSTPSTAVPARADTPPASL